MTRTKLVEQLAIDDLKRSPVWRFAKSTGPNIRVTPVSRLPVASLAGHIVGAQLTLANGDRPWCTLANVNVNNAAFNQQFLTLSVERDGTWFHLARYFDYDFEERGPGPLAHFLGRQVDDVFPVRYDLRPYARGASEALVGEITAEPLTRLTRDERMSLSLG